MNAAEPHFDVLSPALAPGAARWPWDGRAFEQDVLPERIERPGAPPSAPMNSASSPNVIVGDLVASDVPAAWASKSCASAGRAP